MLKSELIELLKDIEDNAEIDGKIQGIEGLAKPIDFTSIGLEDFKSLLANNKEAKAYYQSTLDTKVSQGINTFKEKTLPGLIQEELKKANNPNKTPEQIALEELQAKFIALEAEKAKADMASKYTKILTEKGLSVDLLDIILGSDDETTNTNIDRVSTIINSLSDAKVSEKIKDTAYVPPGNKNGENKNPWSRDNFNLTEQGNILRENPALAKQLMASAK
jgi:hypothetical protein